jgi:hypothetical protein
VSVRPGPGRPDTAFSPHSPSLLTAGWRPALAHAGIAFLATIGLGVAVAALRFATEGGSVLRIPRGGGLVFALFHRVPIEVEVPAPSPASFGDLDISVSFTGALVGGTLLAMWLLYRGGAAVARTTSGSPWARALHGAKVAPPYALLAVVISLLASVPAGVAGLGSEGASLHPSPLGALVWPLLLASGAGAAGGLSAAGPKLFGGPFGSLRGPAAGGWRMAWLAVLLGTVGVLVVAGLDPQRTRAFFDGAVRVTNPGTAVASTLLFLPNAGTGAAVAAMGGSVDLEAPGLSCAVMSYGRFPAGLSTRSAPIETVGLDRCGALPFELDAAPLGYFLFLLVPVVATIAGGWGAAGLEGAGTPGAGARAGALSAPVFAAATWGFAYLSRVSYEAAVVGFGGEVTLGPDLWGAFFLPLGWGLAGGAVGGALAGRARARDEPGPVEETGS